MRRSDPGVRPTTDSDEVDTHSPTLTSVPQRKQDDAPADGTVVDCTRFTAHDWEVWHEAYCRGYLDGAAVQQAEDFAPIEAAARASVRRTAASPDHATLWERRGHPARAQAVREHWRATGLVKGPA